MGSAVEESALLSSPQQNDKGLLRSENCALHPIFTIRLTVAPMAVIMIPMQMDEIAVAAVLGLVIGLILGWFIGWVVGRMGARAEKQRADQLTEDLKQRTEALNAAQSSLEAARREHADLEAAHNEQDAKRREEIATLRTRLDNAEKDAEKTAGFLEELRVENARVSGELFQSRNELTALRAKFEGEQKSHEEKLAILTSARVELSNQFETLANDILEKKSKTFTEQNQTNIGNLLNPLREKFGEFQQKVESLEKENLTGRTELKTQIDQLRTLNERLSQDATNLVTALKGSSKTQGDWGEQLLETILEAAGLRKGHEYLTQESFTRDDRSRARPDVIVNLPEGRNIILDSKVSLNAYNDYCAAQDDGAREDALNRHLISVRNHIRELSDREYQRIAGLNSPDFVVMFMPLEPAFMLAIARDSRLWQEAWEKNVLLVSPSTLLFVLRTVAHLWRQELQARNLKEITDRGAELYDKLAAFAADLTDVGKNLDKARDSYDDACKKLSTGKGNVIRQAEMLKSLGIKPTKVIPIALVERSQEGEPLELAATEESETGIS